MNEYSLAKVQTVYFQSLSVKSISTMTFEEDVTTIPTCYAG